MTPVELSRTVLRAVRRAVDGGELRVTVPEKVSVTVPGAGGWGDYATNIALQLARPAGETPRRVAELLRPHLVGAHGVSGVEITGPGFLNIRLMRGSAVSVPLVEEILQRGPRYGFVDEAAVGASHAALPEPDGSRDALAGQHLSSSPDALTCEPAPSSATALTREHTPIPYLVQLHAPHEPRALVVMEVVARLLRSQGSLVRTSCAARPEPEWLAVLGVDVDAYGTPAAPAPLDVNVRPVPVPDPAALLTLGRDAARWALLHPAAHDRPRLTAEHLVQRESNPLFRVRYAYARTRAISRNAADLGFTAQPGDVQEDTTPLVAPLLTHLADHPRLLARAAAHHTPDLLARHLVAVADATLVFLPAALPLGDEKPSAAHRARLALAEAAGAVLAGGLSLLGIDAPQHL
ncbi:DALR anticodon-binding domain-containing protein [Streptomyces prunicolor]|uniref:ArgS-related anticodon-binding protein NrtL n=1 Tax=Streptomyces prunicolor TaxID=67348 RepID=UPI00224E3805|nr:DALR anticodon-binding domain-containing protein [Streptomyces prunicolor]MCX5237607.1 DALR anticodon-binding domain-containing protein [Streptomyces prunicolor]